MVSPALRRALHECVDILCDAVNQDAQAQPQVKPQKKSRPVAPPSPDCKIDEVTIRRALEAGRKAGLL